jgi:dTDP-4-amino-4,6-dideoxygalactose transaminase
MKRSVTRRQFIGRAAVTGSAMSLGLSAPAAEKATPAPVSPATTKATVKWPRWDDREENALLKVLHSGKWGRTSGGTTVRDFESAFAEKMGAKFCLATSAGTTALLTSLGALGIGPGDEVVLPAYTFVATFNVITSNYALPVFVDADPATFQIDPRKIATAITSNTKLLLPVHMGGSVADLDAIQTEARAHGVPVLEDACQAPLAEWRGRPVGTSGTGGCISFQASKNLTAGEGGAILTNDETFLNLCYNFHLPGGNRPVPSSGRAANYRMTEFQGGILLAQLSRLEHHAQIRDTNAAHLTSLLTQIPGITPARLTPGCTRSAYHFYMFRYDARQFENLSRQKFFQALNAEGISASGGYKNLTTMPHVQALASNRHYLKIYGKEGMSRWLEKIRCPVNDQLCEEGVWFQHHALLGTRADMERIAETIAAIRKRAGQLARV